MSQWWRTRRTKTSEFQDYHIPLWSTRRIPAFENWFRKSRTTRTDMLFNETHNKVHHFILTVQNQNKSFRMLGNIELCELLETERKTRCTVCLLYWNTGILYCTFWHSLHNERRANQKFIKYTMDLLSVLIMSSGREDLMDIDMVKSRETKKIKRANQLRKKCQKREFQRIHNRFLRNRTFRIRMIENHREEDLLSTMGCSCGWRSHSPCDNTRTLLLRLQQEAGEEPHVPTYTYKHQQWEARSSSSAWWTWQGSWWTPSVRKSRRRCTKYWMNGATCCLQYLASFFGRDFHEFNLFWYRLIVYSWRRSTVTDGRFKDNTSNDPFSRC